VTGLTDRIAIAEKTAPIVIAVTQSRRLGLSVPSTAQLAQNKNE